MAAAERGAFSVFEFVSAGDGKRVLSAGGSRSLSASKSSGSSF